MIMGLLRRWVVLTGLFALSGLYGCSSSEPAIEIDLKPLALEVEVNSPKTLTVTLSRKNLDNALPIRLELENPPATLSMDQLPATVKNSSASFTITSSIEGTFNLKLKASTETVSKTVSFTLKVIKTSGFTFSATPLQLNLSPSEKGLVTINISRSTLPESTPVRVRIKNPPTTITSTPIRINDSSGTLAISASQVGTYNLTLLAIADGVKKELPITVQVGSKTLVKETIASGLEVPWDLTFTPAGELYFTERKGNIKKVVAGSVVDISHPLDVLAETESGLMGMDFSPDYPQEPYLYVCYSYLESPGVIKNRVSRLTLSGDALTDETILINAIPGSTNHDGCRIAFGPDKKLYVSMGDAKVSGNAQDTNSLSGKTLRVNADGSIPTDNPFGNAVWSYGHRNSQGLAFDSKGQLYASEHGDNDEDEINLITKGANYGWPYVEGRCNTESEHTYCDSMNLQEPFTVYTPTIAVSGLAFYNGDMFPEWKGDLLLASLKEGQLHHIDLDDIGNIIGDDIVIKKDYGRLRDVEVAPDGSIYIAVSNQDGRGIDPFDNEPDRIIRWSKQ
jgi:aldose sugar dehydrogenase